MELIKYHHNNTFVNLLQIDKNSKLIAQKY